MGKLNKSAFVVMLAVGLLVGCAAVRAEEGPTLGTREIDVTPAPTSVEPPLDIKLWADREHYRVGEQVIFFVEATNDCHLTLLNVGTSGQVKFLFPSQFQRANLIKAGIVHRIPAPGAPFELTFVGPPGTEGVMAICATDNIPVVTQPTAAGPASSTLPGAPTATVKDIEVQLKPVPKERWATATIKLEVKPRSL